MSMRHRGFPRTAAAAIAAVFSLGLAFPASAVTFTPLPSFTDTDFNNAIANGDFAEDVLLQLRGGSAGLSGDWEVGIEEVEPPGPGGTPGPTAQFLWPNGQSVSFSASYDGTTLIYNYGGNTIQSTNIQDLSAMNGMLIRLRSNGDGSSIALSNIVVDGMSFGATVAANDADTIEYLEVRGLATTFTMSWDATLSWTTTDIPRGSRLASQIKVGAFYDEAVIPVPAALPLMATGIGLVAVMMRRRASRNST